MRICTREPRRCGETVPEDRVAIAQASSNMILKGENGELLHSHKRLPSVDILHQAPWATSCHPRRTRPSTATSSLCCPMGVPERGLCNLDCRQTFPQIGPAPVARRLPNLGRVWAKWGRNRPNSIELGPNVPRFGATSATIGQCVPESPKFGSISTDVGSKLAKSGISAWDRPNLAWSRPDSTNIFPASAKLGPQLTKFDQE